MFEKFKEEKEPIMCNSVRKELLNEIWLNNCREFLIHKINIRSAERSKTDYPNRLGEIEDFINKEKMRLKDLFMGIEVINDEIKEYEKENKKREGD